MPGGVPVGTLAIGKAGATNAGLLAVAILADLASRPCARSCARFAPSRPRKVREDSLAVSRVILPGATIGVLGSGQLGRMLAIAARRMGYRVHTLSPDEDTPTGQVADLEITADYEDLDAIRAFAKGVARRHVRVRERVDRSRGRGGGARAGAAERLGAAHHAAARAREGVSRRSRVSHDAVRRRCTRSTSSPSRWARSASPAIVKTAAFGYDGKGQHRITSIEDAERVWGLIGHQEAVVERVVDFTHELSVVAARGLDGDFAHFGAIENAHTQSHPRPLGFAGARVRPASAAEAVQLTRAIMEELDLRRRALRRVLPDRDGRLLVNEIAPRPHNSGHLTFDACVTSQFEQQVRAVCGLPLGSTRAAAAGGDGQPAGRSVGERRARLERRAGASRREAASLRQDASRAPAARWATSRRWPTPWTKREKPHSARSARLSGRDRCWA